MPEITIDDTAYRGSTSRPPWRPPHDPLTCRGCGSSLHGRREAVRRDSSRGIVFVVETFMCRCNRRREIKREVASA